MSACVTSANALQAVRIMHTDSRMDSHFFMRISLHILFRGFSPFYLLF